MVLNFLKKCIGNVKWFFTEIMNMYSDKPSFFSKKRIESGIAFIIGQWGMVAWLKLKAPSMTMSDFALWAGIEFAVSGYMITQIQREKFRVSDVESGQTSTDAEGSVLSPSRSSEKNF